MELQESKPTFRKSLLISKNQKKKRRKKKDQKESQENNDEGSTDETEPDCSDVIDIDDIPPASPIVVNVKKKRTEKSPDREPRSPTEASPPKKKSKSDDSETVELMKVQNDLTDLLDSDSTFFSNDNQAFISQIKSVADSATKRLSEISDESNASAYANFIKKYIEIVPALQSQMKRYETELKRSQDEIKDLSQKLAVANSDSESEKSDKLVGETESNPSSPKDSSA